MKDKRIILRDRIILLSLSGRSTEGANLWWIVNAEPYARCRSKTPMDPRLSLVGPGQSPVGSRMKCRVRQGETMSG